MEKSLAGLPGLIFFCWAGGKKVDMISESELALYSLHGWKIIFFLLLTGHCLHSDLQGVCVSVWPHFIVGLSIV